MLPREFVHPVARDMRQGWGRRERPPCRLGLLSLAMVLVGVSCVEEEEEEESLEGALQGRRDWNKESASLLSCRWAHGSSSAVAAAAAAADEAAAAAAAAACCYASVESLARVDAF